VVTAAGVAVTGVIGFVGLVIPHLARLVLGPDHRVLMPVSVLVGGIFLVLADVVARNLLQPVVLQTGTVTAFLGAPVLLALIIRRQNR
jgi:iron complex transport system permease protein